MVKAFRGRLEGVGGQMLENRKRNVEGAHETRKKGACKFEKYSGGINVLTLATNLEPAGVYQTGLISSVTCYGLLLFRMLVPELTKFYQIFRTKSCGRSYKLGATLSPGGKN